MALAVVVCFCSGAETSADAPVPDSISEALQGLRVKRGGGHGGGGGNFKISILNLKNVDLNYEF